MNNLDNIVTLTDAEDNEIDFEILDILTYADVDYAVLLPLDDESDAPEVTILEVIHAEQEDDPDTLQGVDDPALLQAVFDAFRERNAELFDFEE